MKTLGYIFLILELLVALIVKSDDMTLAQSIYNLAFIISGTALVIASNKKESK